MNVAVEQDTGTGHAERPGFVSLGPPLSAERFENPQLLEAGKVVVLTLQAVLERFGRKWEMRREQVFDYVERTLDRHVGIEGFYLRVSETDYLVCQPELGSHAGQAICLRSLRDILHHFLGDDTEADHGIHLVTRIINGAVEAVQIDVRAVEMAEPLLTKGEPPKAASLPQLPRVDEWSPFVASNGREVRVSCALEPVYELKTYGRIGFRLSRRVVVTKTEEALTPAAVANLSRSDLLRIDLATIARGVDRLRSDAGSARQPSLIIPVSFTSLSTLAGRTQIVAAFNGASAFVDKGIVCEICDIDGVPQGALLTATSLIRPFALFVVGRLDARLRQPLTALKGAGLDALSFECPAGQTDTAFTAWATNTIGAAKKIAKSVLVYRVASSRQAGLAGLIGASHASVASGGS